MPEQTLHEAARELHQATLALKELIEREYPRRSEIEENFTKKVDSARKFVILMVLVLVTTLLSFVGVVGTVSHCFLSRAEHSACGVIPGYENRNDRRNELYDDLDFVQDEVDRLNDEVDDLDSRLYYLEKTK